ncbi:MAG TPA: hypothetical protein VNZ94_00545 [Xanthobacteraceae bacterium]|nr:hypothetical protein [Xanthobacteraceae bacterium]
MNEIVTWSAIVAAIGCVMALAKFWSTYSDRITRAEATAETAKTQAHEAGEKVAVMSAAFALYREQVAREYIHREVMREVEDRLTQAIERLGDRFDRFVETSARGTA